MKIWRRQLGREPVLVATIVVALLLSATLVALAPRVLEHASGQDLEHAIVNATPAQRNVQLATRSRLGAGSLQDRFRHVRLAGERLRDEAFPESVDALIADQYFQVDSPPFRLSSYPDQIEGPFPTTFRFRYQQGIEDEFVLVQGAMPVEREPIPMYNGRDCPDQGPAPADFEPEDEQDCYVEDVPVYEIAVTAQTAEDMQMELGELHMLGPSLQDRQWLRATSERNLRLVVTISGIVELSDPGGEFWYGDSSLHRPRITENADYRLVFAYGLFAPELYRPLLRDVPIVDWDYRWRYLITPDLVTRSDVDVLNSDLSKIAAPEVQISTQLPELVRDHLAQRRLTVSLLTVIVAGLAAVTIAAIYVVSLLIRRRHQHLDALLVDRGASRSRQALSAATTAVVLVSGPAAGGWFLARSLLGETNGATSAEAVSWLGCAAGAAIVIAMAPLRPFRSGADGGQRSIQKLRRILIEVLVVVGAAGAAMLLRRRGGDSETDLLQTADELLVLVPVLLLGVVGVVLGRLLGPIVQLLARVANRSTGLVAHFSLRRAAELPLTDRTPSMVVAAAAAVAVLTLTIGAAIERGQQDFAFDQVGSDYRIDSSIESVPLPPTIERAVDGAGLGWASGAEIFDATVITEDGGAVATIVAIDAEAYGALLRSAGRDSSLVDELLRKSDPSSTVPMLRSGPWPRAAEPSLGDDVEIRVANAEITATIVGTDAMVRGRTSGGPTLIVDRGTVEGLVGSRSVATSFVHVFSSDDLPQPVADAIAGEIASVRTVSRATVTESVAGDPFSLWTDRVFLGVTVGAALFGAIGVVAGAALAASARRRDVALLRTMGLARPQMVKLALLEEGPARLIAVGLGVATGLVIVVLLAPVLDLGAFSGGTDPELEIGVLDTVAVVAALVTTLAATFVIQTLRSRRTANDVTLLRVGDE